MINREFDLQSAGNSLPIFVCSESNLHVRVPQWRVLSGMEDQDENSTSEHSRHHASPALLVISRNPAFFWRYQNASYSGSRMLHFSGTLKQLGTWPAMTAAQRQEFLENVNKPLWSWRLASSRGRRYHCFCHHRRPTYPSCQRHLSSGKFLAKTSLSKCATRLTRFIKPVS